MRRMYLSSVRRCFAIALAVLPLTAFGDEAGDSDGRRQPVTREKQGEQRSRDAATLIGIRPDKTFQTKLKAAIGSRNRAEELREFARFEYALDKQGDRH